MYVIKDSIAMLQQHAVGRESILVSYSGGKDSLVVLDLCSKIYPRVVCFFMYFIPNLDVVEKQMDYARNKYGVQILYYPHWSLLNALKYNTYRDEDKTFAGLRDYGLNDINHIASRETGIDAIAHGAKKSDSIWRAKTMGTKIYKNIVTPLADWNKWDVLAYCKANDLPVPDSSKGTASGIGLTRKELFWLHDNHKEDFDRLARVFKYAPAAIAQREFYGKEKR